MKVRVTLVIMSLLSTLSRSSKLLKVPRVYNAFVTSDDDLQSSQTYPILAPVVQSYQFSVPRSYVSTNVYRSLGSPNPLQYGYSYTVQNTVKEDHYQYNVVETGLPFQVELPTVTTMIAEKSPAEQVILFSPTNSFTIRNGNPAKVGGNRFLLLETNPVEQDDDDLPDPQPLESKGNDVRLQRAHHRFRESTRPKNANGVLRSPPPDDDPPYNKPSSIVKAKKPKTDSSSNDFVNENDDNENEDVVKNNRPKDETIVDVPPPPIPTRWKPNKKSSGARRTEEYPPPAVGSI